MRYEVYLDSYFWLNFVLNCFILKLTGTLLGLRMIKKRLVIGALLAALLSCIGIFIPLPGSFKLSVWQIICSALAIETAFQPNRIKSFCYALAFQFAAGSIIGGMVNWAARMLSYSRPDAGPVSPILLLLAAGGGSMLVQKIVRAQKNRRKQRIFDVTLQEKEREIQVKALLDTGNSLTEPFSQKPVCILEQRMLEQVADASYRMENPQKNRIIPYHSIGRPHGLMQGFCIGRMWIDTGTGRIGLKDVVIAASENEIAGNGQYQMILHPSLIGEEEEST